MQKWGSLCAENLFSAVVMAEKARVPCQSPAVASQALFLKFKVFFIGASHRLAFDAFWKESAKAIQDSSF
jgi:hypothetical protein